MPRLSLTYVALQSIGMCVTMLEPAPTHSEIEEAPAPRHRITASCRTMVRGRYHEQGHEFPPNVSSSESILCDSSHGDCRGANYLPRRRRSAGCNRSDD